MHYSRTLLTLVFAFVFSLSHSQDWSGQTYKFNNIYPGSITNLKGETIKGYVLHGDRKINQVECHFYTDENDAKTRKIYKPADLKGYTVADKTYRTISWSGGLAKNPVNFVLAVNPGRITQFIYYLENTGAESDEQMLWMREGDAPVMHKDFILGFAKKMSKLVSDYPELAKKVEDKEKGYGIAKVFQIVEEYNKWWATKESK